MTEDYTTDSMNTQLNSFLHAQARKLACTGRALLFKLDFKNTLKISDSDKKSFDVQENYLQSFRSVYTDKSFKYIRVQNWEFEFEFQGKKCAKLTLVSDQIAFIANKNNKKQLKDITFRVHIAGSEQIAKFPKQIRGYLNRIGKRHLVSQSQNMAEEFFSLMSFSKSGLVEPEQVKRLGDSFEEQTKEENPIQCLNNDGKKIIEKLKHFISRQNIFDFIVRQQLSTEGQNKLSALIAPSTEGKSKKKVKL